MNKLPETKDEIKASLARNGMIGLKACANFLTGVGKQGTWNGIPVTKEDMMRIRPTIIEILDELKAQGQ